MRRYAGPPPGAPTAFVAAETAMTEAPWQDPGRSGKAQDDKNDKNRFPAPYYPQTTAEDTQHLIRQQVLAAPPYGAGTSAQLVYPIGPEDFKYAEKKAAAQEFAEFTVWCEQWFDMADPAQIRIFQESFPEYFEKRVAQIQNLGENMTRFAIIRMFGPRSKEDFMFLWMVQTGRVTLISAPLWEPSAWAKQGPEPKLALFNPWRMLSRSNAPNMPNIQNRVDPLGNPDRRYDVPAKPDESRYQTRETGGMLNWTGGYPGWKTSYTADPTPQAGYNLGYNSEAHPNPAFGRRA